MQANLQRIVSWLQTAQTCSYSPEGIWAAEPTAMTCLALAASGEEQAALRLVQQLSRVQTNLGSVPVMEEQDTPAWTTSLAILAWLACENFRTQSFAANIDRAVAWTLSTHGKPADPNPEVGHDPSIPGWSWAENTHSWLEPTAMFAIALKAAGFENHARTRAAIRLVTDRLLPEGGSNYGSTLVLGQATLPQIQSTGLSLLALANEANTDPRIEKSLHYVEQNLSEQTSTASLCYGLLGLTAHDRRPPQAEALLAGAGERELERGPSAYKLALLALASFSDTSWLPTRSEVAHA